MKTFKGMNIYVGLDVHKASVEMKVFSDNLSLGNAVKLRPFSSEVIFKYLNKHYPGANYHCVYEAGFSGFWLQRELEGLGINCRIVNPADVPTSHKDKIYKNDKVDCIKLGKGLRSSDLRGIYVLNEKQELDRCLLRQRGKVAKNISRTKNQIKSHLNFIGVKIDWEEGTSERYWSKRMISQIMANSKKRKDLALQGFLETLEALRKENLKGLRRIRELSKRSEHKKAAEALIGIKGIGNLSAMIIKTELVDIERFSSFDHLQSYVGLIPGQRSSSDSDVKGKITRRSNVRLRGVLIQCAWAAVRFDSEMSVYYEEQKQRLRRSQLAIIKVAVKMLRKIKYEWENANMGNEACH